MEVQEFDFTVMNASGNNIDVPDTPSRDAVRESLGQRCLDPIDNSLKYDHVIFSDTVNTIVGPAIVGSGPSVKHTKQKQEKQ